MISGSLAIAFLAGIFSTLSPCVLPLVPLVLGAALTVHRFGPVALAAGLAISFVAIGLFVATIGFSLGLNGDSFRAVSAVLMTAVGLLLLIKRLQDRLSAVLSPIGNLIQSRFGMASGNSLTGQFGVGLLLGAVWSPCVGPTLGAASVLASQGKDLVQVAGTMAIFGLGAALPLLVLGALSQEALKRRRTQLAKTGDLGKRALGGALVLFGVLILSGADKQLEAYLVAASPEWLTRLTTRY
jgi:cytochrome c biogenesis protein CcdA